MINRKVRECQNDFRPAGGADIFPAAHRIPSPQFGESQDEAGGRAGREDHDPVDQGSLALLPAIVYLESWFILELFVGIFLHSGVEQSPKRCHLLNSRSALSALRLFIAAKVPL
jgi:hypothetical protein